MSKSSGLGIKWSLTCQRPIVQICVMSNWAHVWIEQVSVWRIHSEEVGMLRMFLSCNCRKTRNHIKTSFRDIADTNTIDINANTLIMMDESQPCPPSSMWCKQFFGKKFYCEWFFSPLQINSSCRCNHNNHDFTICPLSHQVLPAVGLPLSSSVFCTDNHTQTYFVLLENDIQYNLTKKQNKQYLWYNKCKRRLGRICIQSVQSIYNKRWEHGGRISIYNIILNEHWAAVGDAVRQHQILALTLTWQFYWGRKCISINGESDISLGSYMKLKRALA